MFTVYLHYVMARYGIISHNHRLGLLAHTHTHVYTHTHSHKSRPQLQFIYKLQTAYNELWTLCSWAADMHA